FASPRGGSVEADGELAPLPRSGAECADGTAVHVHEAAHQCQPPGPAPRCGPGPARIERTSRRSFSGVRWTCRHRCRGLENDRASGRVTAALPAHLLPLKGLSTLNVVATE